jgi:hypothetical protein
MSHRRAHCRGRAGRGRVVGQFVEADQAVTLAGRRCCGSTRRVSSSITSTTGCRNRSAREETTCNDSDSFDAPTHACRRALYR